MLPKKTFSTAAGLGVLLGLGLLFSDIAPAAAAPPRHAPAHGYRRKARARQTYRPAATIWPRPTRSSRVRRGVRDRDGDGIRNRWDRDRDGDGVRNRRDRAPNNPRLGARDMDGDGIPNVRDRDRDGDGVRNARDRYPNNPRRR